MREEDDVQGAHVCGIKEPHPSPANRYAFQLLLRLQRAQGSLRTTSSKQQQRNGDAPVQLLLILERRKQDALTSNTIPAAHQRRHEGATGVDSCCKRSEESLQLHCSCRGGLYICICCLRGGERSRCTIGTSWEGLENRTTSAGFAGGVCCCSMKDTSL